MIPNASLEKIRTAVGPTARGVEVRRVRFVEHPISGTKIRTTFKQPRPCLAVEQSIEFKELASESTQFESADSLIVAYVPREAKIAGEQILSACAASNPAETPPAVSFDFQGETVHWRPGFVVVEGASGLRDDVLLGLVEFAFYEREVRALEQKVSQYTAQARLDSSKTHVVKPKDRKDWKRFPQVMEELMQLRFDFAEVEPRVQRGSRQLTKRGRQIATRLFRLSNTGERMEGLDGQLEMCEEMYDGVLDRIAEHHGWRQGHILEVIIIAMLLLEVLFMCADLLLRVYD
jgi:hypothetical protein